MADDQPNIARFRFYEELNDFLPEHRRKRIFAYAFRGRPAVKNAIEGMGVPHTEIDLILVNGRSVGFRHPLRHGDFVSVYPVFETFDISPLIKLNETPLRRPAFILDVHLGTLARRLRLLGFDALYRNDYRDPEIVGIAAREKRTILTRDRGLLCRGAVTRGYRIRSQDPDRQVREVLDRFDLYGRTAPFTRCTACNGRLDPVPKRDVSAQLAPGTLRCHDTFFRCRTCGKIYWEGAHFSRLKLLVERCADRRPGEG
jgi:uncharacterized protein with PIN domain